MIVIGIESTAHTAGVGAVNTELSGADVVLSNNISTYLPEKGGIHPRLAAEHHNTVLPELIRRTFSDLADSGISPADVDAVAFAQGPGLGPCLRSGAVAARALSVSLDVPIVGVNHCVAHLEIGRRIYPDCEDPLLLYVSGGNTQVIAYAAGRYRVFGETMDIGIGNMLDKFARNMGIPFPGGPRIEEMAKKGAKYITLPYSVSGMDVAFSGILTAARSLKGRKPIEDVCYSLQETAFAMLVEVTERALAHTGKNSVLLGGGVARNMRLQEMVRIMAEDRGLDFYVPPPSLCVDNGAMIANLGALMYEHEGGIPLSETGVMQRYRTDEVPVTWRS